MRIPSKGKYAVSAMLDLALHDQARPLTIAEISERQNISLSYLEQLFSSLRNGGLVRGTRGPGGGYKLAKAPEQINIAQIIHSLDDKGNSGLTVRSEYAPFQMWDDLSRQLHEFLTNISLSDCIKKGVEDGMKSNESAASYAE